MQLFKNNNNLVTENTNLKLHLNKLQEDFKKGNDIKNLVMSFFKLINNFKITKMNNFITF